MSKEAKKRRGKYGENPFLAGQNKWDVVYKGVDVMSGNFTTTATDLSFQGGFGDPINVTRSYSANDVDEGPFGKGWTLSADVRQTAGGVLKKPSAPVRAVPVSFNERPAAQLNDPGAVGEDGSENVQPVQAVVATDATGKPETEQRDMDGVVSTPPWDDNVNSVSYEFDTLNGSTYQVMASCTTSTPDGTVYVYAKEGSYVNGVIPFGSTATTGAYSNVLKVLSVTDRNNNTTTYGYGSTLYQFVKGNGTTSEYPLTSVHMQGGQNLTFAWTSQDGPHTDQMRVTSVTDNSRTVNYTYTSYSVPSGGTTYILSTETSPAGRPTVYAYGNPYSSTAYLQYSSAQASNLLTSITDPRGLVTTMNYAMVFIVAQPWQADMECPWCYQVTEPNGVVVGFNNAFVGSSSYLPSSAQVLAVPAQPSNPPPLSIVSEYAGGAYQTAMLVCAQADTSVADYEVWTFTWPGYYAPAFGFSDPTDASWNHMVYDGATQNLLSTMTYTHPMLGASHGSDNLIAQRNMAYSNFSREEVETDQTYNFMGNPLSKVVTESEWPYGGDTNPTVVTRDNWYAYWGQAEYYQQMAVLANNGLVLSYTTYNPAGSSSGVGMTNSVYDAKFGGLGSVTLSGSPPQPPSGWYNLTPSGMPSATFSYDAQGRSIVVNRLVTNTQGGSNFYTQTTTSYYPNSTPNCGLAQTVTEDAAPPGLTQNPNQQPYMNRTTTTNSYDSAGDALDVTGPTGEFITTYDPDGLIGTVKQEINQNGMVTYQNIVTYEYGSNPSMAGINNGQPIQIVDGLTGVTQNIAYDGNADGGKGEVASVSQNLTTAGTGAYTTTYNYAPHGERSFATYMTPNDTEMWWYRDFVQVGQGAEDKLVFQTLVKITGSVTSPQPTSEEEDYAYDTSGRVQNAAFCQSPQSGYTPGSGQLWYSSSEEPASRSREFFDFDPAGRCLNLQYFWETFNATSTSPVTNTDITGWNYTYENTGQARGLKLTASLYNWNAPGSTWTLDHTEDYAYENQRSILTGAQYNDGQPISNPTWSYDAGQNRNDSITNDLNETGYYQQHTWIPTTDPAGRTTTRGAGSLAWDPVSRLTSYTLSGVADTYEYRADGMRDHRYLAGSSPVNWSYYHDGQMSMEDEQITPANVLTVTRYGLGARGIDECEQQTGTVSNGVHTLNSSTSVWYPIFDGHGNQCGTLSRAANNSFTQANTRTFDCWGNVRKGSATGAPASRYCGNLGHVQDDESSLIYVRARYYDPATGRFVSEDPSRQGANWQVYCSNDPVNKVDCSGKGSFSCGAALISFFFALLGVVICSICFGEAVGAGALIVGTIFSIIQGLKQSKRSVIS